MNYRSSHFQGINPECSTMALPVKTNQAAMTGERQENETMTTLNLNTASQKELEAYIADNSLTMDGLADLHMDGLTAVGSAQRAMAALINKTLKAKEGQRNWFDVEYRETGDLASVWQPHRRAILDLYKARKHSNPSEALKEIKKQGYKLIHGEPPKAPTSKTRDIFDRLAEDLVRLYKAGINPENEETIKHHKQSAKIRAALAQITKALKELDRLPEAD